MSIETLYIVRHGHIDVGEEKRYVGVTNIPLDALGMKQAEALGRFFSPLSIDAMFTSPLTRCTQTAYEIARLHNLAYTPIEDLREIDMGEWEYQTFAFIKSHYPHLYEERGLDMEHFIPPKGESFSMLLKRVKKAFKVIAKTDAKTVVIVAHAGVNRVLLASLLGIDLKDIFSIQQPYGCTYVVTYAKEEDRWKQKSIIF